MKNLTLRNIVKVCRGVYHGPEEALDREVDSIITDSRKAEAGALFVAIVGERVDAHKFIPDVMAKGRSGLCFGERTEGRGFPLYPGGIFSSGGEGYRGILSGTASDPCGGDHRKRG